MREVIQKVMAAEAEAKQRVQAATAEAERIISAARGRAQDLVAAAGAAARAEADQILAGAVQSTATEKQQRLEAVTAEIETQVRVDETMVRQATEAVTRCLCGSRPGTQGMTS